MQAPTKRTVMESLLEVGSAFVYLDPRRPEVRVPPWLRQQPQLVLQMGLDMPIPIPDLAVDDDGIVATLSFQRTPHRCVLPWSAVFALVGDDGRGTVFLESVPDEIRREIDREAAASKPEPAIERDGPDPDEGDADDPGDDAEDSAVQTHAPERGGNVIPLWPRGVRAKRPSVAPSPSLTRPSIRPSSPAQGLAPAPAPAPKPADASLPPTDGPQGPDDPKPRPPHLRRVK